MQEIARLYAKEESQVYVGAEATEEKVKAEAGEFRILHLAAHAELDPVSPLYSSIVLAQAVEGSLEDGFLEAWEIMSLDLAADLAVLPNCQTARGQLTRGGRGRPFLGAFHRRMSDGCAGPVERAGREHIAADGRFLPASTDTDDRSGSAAGGSAVASLGGILSSLPLGESWSLSGQGASTDSYSAKVSVRRAACRSLRRLRTMSESG